MKKNSDINTIYCPNCKTILSKEIDKNRGQMPFFKCTCSNLCIYIFNAHIIIGLSYNDQYKFEFDDIIKYFINENCIFISINKITKRTDLNFKLSELPIQSIIDYLYLLLSNQHLI